VRWNGQAHPVRLIFNIRRILIMELSGSWEEHYATYYSDIHRAVVNKIHYHWIDTPCCQTCEYVDSECEDDYRCKFTKFREDRKEFGRDNLFTWMVEPFGICDHYKKRLEKTVTKQE
jgi:hypothetical protein